MLTLFYMSCLSYYNPKQKTHFPFFQEMSRYGLLKSPGLPTRGRNRPIATQTGQNLSAQAYQEIFETHKEILFYARILEKMEMSDYSNCWQEFRVLLDKKPIQESSRCDGQQKLWSHSLNNYLLSTYYVSGSVPDAGMQQSMTDKTSGFRGVDILMEKGE